MTAEIVPLRPVYGATPDEWLHFALVVGEADLLPVVSRPGAQISEHSTMKGLGKTPSLYNPQRRVVGIPKWTQLQATSAMVETWAKESDYGLCIQTRRVRALDVDAPDPDLASRIAERFVELLAVGELPRRSRQGTGKTLLAFELVGQYAKRSFKLRDGAGIVEFLGNGQQFIALGEHFDGAGAPSGTRYAWTGDLPVAFPVVTPAQFEAAWAALVAEFAAEPAVEGGAAQSRDRADIEGLDDPVAGYLHEQGLVIGHQGEKLFVACPWKSGHSSDSGVSESAWLIAGTKGFERGHYQCLHASCQGREDVEFLDAVGFRVAAFKALGPEDGEDGDAGPLAAKNETGQPNADVPWPTFRRNPTTGKIDATLDNVQRALACPPMVGMEVRYDTFRDELVADGLPFKDAHSVRLRNALELRGFKPIGRELMRDALLMHAEDNLYDSAQDWLRGLPAWDGVERVELMYPWLFNTEDTPYTRAVGRYTMTALAGRVLRPGCKVDMVPILAGDQGFLKSSAVMALAPDLGPGGGTFRVLNLHDLESANLSRRLRGCLVGELAELRGLRTRDAESIKAWIVQQEERWVPKFVERETAFPRRLLMFGTTNPVGVLDDETGERRWLPMAVTAKIDLGALEAVRDQLWAEGLWRYELLGIEWQDAERLATAEHEAFKVRDPLESRVVEWLYGASDITGQSPFDRGQLLMADLLESVRASGAERLTSPRAGKILRALGWKSQGIRVNDRPVWGWVRAVRSCEVSCEG